MKKLFYLLMLIPLGLFCSCDKDDFSPFDMTLTLSGVTELNGSFYTVAGEEVTIESLTVDPVGGKATTVANVMFYLNNTPLFRNPWAVDAPTYFSTQNLNPGTYNIGVTGNLLQVDQSVNVFTSNFPLEIVADQEDLPEGAPEIGTYSITIHCSK